MLNVDISQILIYETPTRATEIAYSLLVKTITMGKHQI